MAAKLKVDEEYILLNENGPEECTTITIVQRRGEVWYTGTTVIDWTILGPAPEGLAVQTRQGKVQLHPKPHCSKRDDRQHEHCQP